MVLTNRSTILAWVLVVALGLLACGATSVALGWVVPGRAAILASTATPVPTTIMVVSTATPVAEPIQTAMPTAMASATTVPTRAPEATKAPEPTKALVVSSCRDWLWFAEAISDTVDTASLIAVFDRDFVLNEGGQWSEPGFRVPANSVFVTDLFGNIGSLPAGVKPIRIQGGWGVFSTSTAYVIPAPNGGGRYLKVCGEVGDFKSVSVATATPATAKPTCVTATEVGIIMNASDKGAEYDHFEGRGYLYGKALKPGETVDAGWLVHANATVFTTTESQKLENGGRGMPVCK